VLLQVAEPAWPEGEREETLGIGDVEDVAASGARQLQVGVLAFEGVERRSEEQEDDGDSGVDWDNDE
jgi:hypothetical protein